jgi:hypothetical protein
MWATPLRCPHIHRASRRHTGALPRYVDSAGQPRLHRPRLAERRTLFQKPNRNAGNSTRRGCTCADDAICRMFLCARCRCQVLVCRRCDRGHTYCLGTCAQDARRERQREARRRYQATPRGRAMHAERNRRYRARRCRVTDQGLAKVEDEFPSPGLPVAAAPAPSARPPRHWLCHRCGQPVSQFLRRSALRRRAPGTQIYGGRTPPQPPTLTVFRQKNADPRSR